MQYVLIIHEVDDYQKWKTGFDAAANIRKSAGELSFQLLKYANAPNKIVHYSHWKSHDQARSFFESDRVKKIRIDLGVKQPEFIYLDELDTGML